MALRYQKSGPRQIYPLIVLFLFTLIITSPVCYSQSGIQWFVNDTLGYNFFPYAVSYDGTVIVGRIDVNSPDGYGSAAVRWDTSKGFELLGDLGGTGFAPYGYATGISADGNTIVGVCKTSASNQVGFRWTSGTGMVALSTGGSSLCTAAGIDSAGDIIAGWYTNPTTYHNDAVRWVNGSLEILNSSLGYSNPVNGISPDGSVIVGGVYLTTTGYEVAATWKDGSVTLLPLIPGKESARAFGSSRNGDVIVGYTAYPQEAFRYTISTGMVSLGIGSDVRSTGNVSPDGKMIVGSVYDGKKRDAAIWYGDHTTPQDLKTKCLLDYGIDVGSYRLESARHISGDRSTIVGTGIDSLGHQIIFRLVLPDTFITVLSPEKGDTLRIHDLDTIRWMSKGIENVNIFLSTNDGVTKSLIALNQPADSEQYFWTVLDSQSTHCRIIITSVGDTIQGMSDEFAIMPDTFIVVQRPAENERWIAGQTDTIRWNSRNVQFVNISFSVNDGADYTLIGWNQPADSCSFVWKVPDSLSAQCRIMVQSFSDTLKGISDRFKVKGYWLTRTNPTADQYELFDISQHGWQFSNTGNIMWPAAWWGGFVYPGGQDPYTHAVYPDRDPFKHAQAKDFIDWPLFVRTMGEQNCYYFFAGNNTSIYKGAAESFWESRKESWGGSCYGFAISTLMAFGMPVDYQNAFPEMPPFNDPPNRYLLSGIGCTDATRMIINSLYFSQKGKQHKTYFRNKYKTTTPKQTLAELREMLMTDVRDDKSLSLVPQNAKGGHEIVAYRITNDPPGSSKFQLYVDDSNIPTNKDAFVEIDTASDTWTYSHLTNSSGAAWGGAKGLTLDDPVSQYTQLPILPKGISSLPTRYKSIFFAEDSTWDVYLPSRADVMITDNAGRSLGVVGDTVKWEIPDASPMKPGTNTSAPPGYTLPKGEYSITVGPFKDTTAVFKLFTDSMIYTYRRYGVDSSQVDRFHLGSDGLMVKNLDISGKRLDLEAIIPIQNDSGEHRILLSGITTESGDSVRFTVDSLSNPVIRNFGSHSTGYDITLLGYQYTEGLGYDQQKFLHQSVILDPNSTHTIRPMWNDLNHKSLKIDIDLGNDGTIDSTSNITDQTLGVGGNGLNEIPKSYGLMQNYPNPFNPMTTISYQLPSQSHVMLKVYDVLGREVASLVNGVQQAGYNSVNFDASKLPSGVYFYRIQAGHYVEMKKMIFVK